MSETSNNTSQFLITNNTNGATINNNAISGTVDTDSWGQNGLNLRSYSGFRTVMVSGSYRYDNELEWRFNAMTGRGEWIPAAKPKPRVSKDDKYVHGM